MHGSSSGEPRQNSTIPMASVRESPITVEATIVEVMSHRLFSASLPNGKRVAAHIPARKAGSADAPALAPGDRVTLELTPYDFSRARIRLHTDGETARNPPRS